MNQLKRIYFVFLLIVINSLILCCSSCENNTWKYNNTIINYPTYSFDELESISNDIKSYSSSRITYQNTILDIEGEITTFRNAFSNTLALNENKNLISLMNGTIICEKLDEGLVIDDESKYSLMIQDNFVYSKKSTNLSISCE